MVKARINKTDDAVAIARAAYEAYVSKDRAAIEELIAEDFHFIAWIYDIYHAGTGNRGKPEDFIARDKILDDITLYWLTETAASSERFYLEQVTRFGEHNTPGRVDLPVAVSKFPNDLPAPRSWARQVYPNLIYWHDLDRGGHFASLEEPRSLCRSSANSGARSGEPGCREIDIDYILSSRLFRRFRRKSQRQSGPTSACGRDELIPPVGEPAFQVRLQPNGA